jgi:hypothetical protein
MKIKKIKAQQEMAGFILIVLMIIIIGVIFLGIFLKKSQTIETIDSEISNFLTASLKYTSNCALEYEPNYQTVKELVEMCFGKSKCLDNQDACETLKSVYGAMIVKFMPAGTIDYYKIGFYHQNAINNSAERKSITSLESGNYSKCPIKRGGQTVYSAASGGYVFAELEICSGV